MRWSPTAPRLSSSGPARHPLTSSGQRGPRAQLTRGVRPRPGAGGQAAGKPSGVAPHPATELGSEAGSRALAARGVPGPRHRPLPRAPPPGRAKTPRGRGGGRRWPTPPSSLSARSGCQRPDTGHLGGTAPCAGPGRGALHLGRPSALASFRPRDGRAHSAAGSRRAPGRGREIPPAAADVISASRGSRARGSAPAAPLARPAARVAQGRRKQGARPWRGSRILGATSCWARRIRTVRLGIPKIARPAGGGEWRNTPPSVKPAPAPRGRGEGGRAVRAPAAGAGARLARRPRWPARTVRSLRGGAHAASWSRGSALRPPASSAAGAPDLRPLRLEV